MGGPIDGTRLDDEVHAVLSTPDGDWTPTIGKRPADDADASAWVDYAVSLGADRGHVMSSYTTEQLRYLADRLGG